jgi:alanine-glyoxylate transaminase/serine-glyoxylate transaminase/serine-pyruvate transaminase
MTASFILPKRTLMGPGPSDVPQRVLDAMARPTIGHLDPAFVELMEQIKSMLRMAFQTQNALTFPVSAPGSAGMEMCFVNLVEPGDKVIVCRNGVFGGRMLENVKRTGGVPVIVDDAWGAPVDPRQGARSLPARIPDASAGVCACRNLDRCAVRRRGAGEDRPGTRRSPSWTASPRSAAPRC